MKDPVKNSVVGGLLLIGFYLIVDHATVIHSLIGMIFWVAAVVISVGYVPAVPGIKLFSQVQDPLPQGRSTWPQGLAFPVALGVLVCAGLSLLYFQNEQWGYSVFFVLLTGVLFFLLGRQFPSFRPGVDQGPLDAWLERPYLAEAAILILGAFFLFSPFPRHLPYFICDGHDDTWTFGIAASFGGDDGSMSPYKYVDEIGCAFLTFFEWMFMKLVGISKLKDVLFISLVNWLGLLIFYRFIAYYLPKRIAFLTTLLLASSHLVIFYARQSYATTGFLVPLTAATLYFFAKALEEGKPRNFAIFGCLLAVDSMAYLTAHIYIFYFLFVLAFLFDKRRSEWLKQKISWFYAFGLAALWYLPMVIYMNRVGGSKGLFSTNLFHLYGVYNSQSGFNWGAFSSFFSVLQMFFSTTQSNEMVKFPFLSPWESILWVIGFAACLRLWRQPAILILFMGFLGGVLPGVIVGGDHIPHRLISAMPFTYFFIGFGLDGLERVVRSPLPSLKSRWIGGVLVGVFVLASIGWQYDVLFHQFTLSKLVWNNENEDVYGHITAQHLKGWDTYDAGIGQDYMPESGAYYSLKDMGNHIGTSLKDIPLPLKNVPQQGALIILNDEYGRLYGDWINYFYPDSPEQLAMNSFGEVQFHYWVITAKQIRDALANPKPFPDSGLILGWHDKAGHLLGRWRVPALSANMLRNQWFGGAPQGPMPGKGAAYYEISGTLDHTRGEELNFMGTGIVSGSIGGVPVQFKDNSGQEKHWVKGVPARWVPINLRYVPTQGSFDLNFYEHDPLGWDWVSAKVLRVKP